MAKEKLFQIGVKALIENDEGLVLLLKAPGWAKNKTPPHWDIPGGRIQEGQTVQEALKREIQEETGVSKILSSEFFSGVVSNHSIPLKNGAKAGLALLIYKVKLPKQSRITMSDEHIGVEWVDKKQAAKRLAEKYPAEFTKQLL